MRRFGDAVMARALVWTVAYRCLRSAAGLGFIICAIAGAQKLPFDVPALMKVARISDPQISPDGRTVASTVQTVDLEGNRKPKQIYTVSVDGGPPRQITNGG